MADDPDALPHDPKVKHVDDTKPGTTNVTVPTGANSEGPSGLGPEWNDWHVIKKAIVGYTDMDNQTAQNFLASNGGGWAQPQTAFDMGDAFATLAETFSYLRDAMVSQTNKLFDSWQGLGAKAYGDVINSASDMLLAQYNAIVAPPGGQSLQNLLYHVGNTLLWAQESIRNVENTFSRAAQAAGAGVYSSEGSGTVTHISETPELANAMTKYFFQIATATNNVFGSDRKQMGTPPPASDFAADPSSTGLDPNGLDSPSLDTSKLQNQLDNLFPNLKDSVSPPGLTDANGNPISAPDVGVGTPPALDGNSLGLPNSPATSPDGLAPGVTGGAPSGVTGGAPSGVPGGGTAPPQIPQLNVGSPPGLGTGGGAPGGVPGLGGLPLSSGAPGSGNEPSSQGRTAPQVKVPQLDVGQPPGLDGSPGTGVTEKNPADAQVPSLNPDSSPLPSVGTDGAGNPISVPSVGIGSPPALGTGGSGGLGGVPGLDTGGTGGVGGIPGLGTSGAGTQVGADGLPIGTAAPNGTGTDLGVGGVSGTGGTGIGTPGAGGLEGTAAGVGGADAAIPGGAELPGAAGQAGGGMPMMPPMMGGMGGAGSQQKEGTNTWLQEHRKPWDLGDTDDIAGTAIGRATGEKDRKRQQQHHLRRHQSTFGQDTTPTATESPAASAQPAGTAEVQVAEASAQG